MGLNGKWLNHLLFTSKLAGSILSWVFSVLLEPSPHVRRVLCQYSVKSRGFSLVVLLFSLAKKVDGVNHVIRAHNNDPALVEKLKEKILSTLS